jgi:hypothetical protein
VRNKAQILKDIAATEAELVDLREELRNWERKQSRKKSDTYKNRKAMLEKSAPLMEDLVEVGDLIEVTGSRAGKWRRVVKLTKGREWRPGKWSCGTVHGHVVYNKRQRTFDEQGGWENVTVEDTTKITDHGTNKIVAVKKNGKWIKAKDLVERLLTSP